MLLEMCCLVIEHDWGELDKDAPLITDVTSRLAVCNMDWDRIRADDILVLLNSFKPERGVIRSVTVFVICFLPHDTMCKRGTCCWLVSVCLSVRPSHSCKYQMAKDIIRLLSRPVSAVTLVS